MASHGATVKANESINFFGLVVGLCTKNTSWALIERPYSREPQAVGAVYDRPGFFVQSPGNPILRTPRTQCSHHAATRSAAQARLIKQRKHRVTFGESHEAAHEFGP